MRSLAKIIPVQNLKNIIVDAVSRKEIMITLMLIYLIGLTATHTGVVDMIRYSVCLIAIIGLLIPSLPKHYTFWLLLGFMLPWSLIPNYSFAGNHYFVTVFFSKERIINIFLTSVVFKLTLLFSN